MQVSGKTSTTGNETGVKDFGKTNYTWTAGAHEEGLESANRNDQNKHRTSLISNKDSKYVELLKNNIAENPKGLALTELSARGDYCRADCPMLLRMGVILFTFDNNGDDNGKEDKSTTFRPVIWNK